MYRYKPGIPRQYRSLTTVALRREDKSRWERRVALTPTAVASLIKETGAKVLVQPSTNRVYNEQQYAKVYNLSFICSDFISHLIYIVL